jgi:hypothetical protein
MFERFTDRARRVLVLAQEEARLLGHNFIGTEHILLGLLQEGEGVAAKALEAVAVSQEEVRRKIKETVGPSGSKTTGSPPFTPRAKTVLELALREALRLMHNYIGTEHILLGLVREGEGVGAQVLTSLGVDLNRVSQKVIQLLSDHHPPPGSGQGEEHESRRPLVGSGKGVEAAPAPLEANALVTWDDVEEILRATAAVETATVERWAADGVDHHSCDYEARLPPRTSVAVAAARVTREAFERSAADHGYVHIDDLGDAAVYQTSTGSLRVLAGGTVFAVTVTGLPDARGTATALARKALDRLRGTAGP